MNEQKANIVKVGALGAATGAATLVAMLVVGAPAADGLAILGQPGTPASYESAFVAHSVLLINVMAIDNLFVLGYTMALIGAAASIWAKARLLGITGVVFAITLALLDLSENALTVQMARTAAAGLPITEGQINWSGVIEQIKYGCATAAVVSLAAGLWVGVMERRRLVGMVVGLFLLFPLANGFAVINPGAKIVLFGWMLVVLSAAALLLWKIKDDIKVAE